MKKKLIIMKKIDKILYQKIACGVIILYNKKIGILISKKIRL